MCQVSVNSLNMKTPVCFYALGNFLELFLWWFSFFHFFLFFPYRTLVIQMLDILEWSLYFLISTFLFRTFVLFLCHFLRNFFNSYLLLRFPFLLMVSKYSYFMNAISSYLPEVINDSFVMSRYLWNLFLPSLFVCLFFRLVCCGLFSMLQISSGARRALDV